MLYSAWLHKAADDLADRGLTKASQWLFELALSCPEDVQQAHLPGSSFDDAAVPLDARFASIYQLAKRHFEQREYATCSSLLSGCTENVKCLWLQGYSSFIEQSTSARDIRMRRLHEILISTAGIEDPFIAYLRGLLLADLGFREEALAELTSSCRRFAYNWSAWLKIIELLENEEELLCVLNDLPDSVIKRLFRIAASLEVHRASELLRHELEELQGMFPDSIHLQAQAALLEYHLRDFEAAEALLDGIHDRAPHRTSELDTYSNILYVVANKTKLSRLAHHFIRIAPHRPETCCLAGNYFSLRGDHTTAIAYFKKAIRLDSRYVSAWTLLGHEYVEMANTHAAIDSYRQACHINTKDYRAWYGLGQAYELLDMQAFSLEYFQRASSLRPFDARMWQAMATCLNKLQRYPAAFKCLKRALTLSESDDLGSMMRMADQCMLMGLLDESKTVWLRILHMSTTSESDPSARNQACLQLAAFELGEHHLQSKHNRTVGDLAKADTYLSLASSTNTEEHQRLTAVLKQLSSHAG